MKKSAALRSKTNSYLVFNDDDVDDSEHKKIQRNKDKCNIKKTLRFKNHKDCNVNNKIILKSQRIFESEKHNVYTKKINKIALSSNDDKGLQTFYKITTYPYGTNAFKARKSETRSKYKR